MSVRVGILGCGMWAGMHASRFKEMGDDIEVAALCDLNTDITEAFAARHFTGTDIKPAHYGDAEKMYAEANLDCVYIVTPHSLHYEHACQALEANVHMLVEKPMVINVKDAYDLRDRINASDRKFIIGYNTPCTPPLVLLRKMIVDQRFGKLQMVTGFLTQDWMRGTTGTWRQKSEISGGGEAYDSGAHLFCSLVWSVASSPKTVSATIETFGAPVDVNSVMNIRFENDVLASIMINGDTRLMGADMSFIFDTARVRIDPWFGTRIQARDAKGAIDISDELGSEAVTPTRHIIDVIQGKSEPTTTPENGVHQSELMDAIYESAKLGRTVSLSELTGKT